MSTNVNDLPAMIELHAGPPPANPPLFLAVIIIGVSVAAPILFSMAGAPNLLFGTATLALACAGLISLFAAISAQRKRRADVLIRRRASICTSGIVFYRQPGFGAPEFFPNMQIKRAWLTAGALILDTTPDHATPGRHRLAFGKLASPREDLIAAITALNEAIRS